jgi:hypothetical protein
MADWPNTPENTTLASDWILHSRYPAADRHS